jgi:hypothetical protein
MDPITKGRPRARRRENHAATPIGERLLLAGCYYDFRRRAWRCPSCRHRAALRLEPQCDGGTALRCGFGCGEGAILRELALPFHAIGPAMFEESAR